VEISLQSSQMMVWHFLCVTLSQGDDCTCCVILQSCCLWRLPFKSCRYYACTNCHVTSSVVLWIFLCNLIDVHPGSHQLLTGVLRRRYSGARGINHYPLCRQLLFFHFFPVKKRWGILHLLRKSGRVLMPISRCKIHSTLKE
jgi:hypothetical protein